MAEGTHVLVMGDSLTFHGPDQAHPPRDPRLWPSIVGAELRAEVDLAAGVGWTARDAWWALTRDPMVWGEYLPAAAALILAVGGMDALPAAIPTYLRQGIAYIRPGWLRRRVRGAYLEISPRVMAMTGGPLRQLPQSATDHYLSRLVEAVRTWYPDLPILLLTPSPHSAAAYPTDRFHAGALAAARVWAVDHDVILVDIEQAAQRGLDNNWVNPDGMHWGWQTHEEIAGMVTEALRDTSVPW
ncbi:MAG: SGNH/GDSL hydrolase family protein [Actinobacteria bacterium]|nr:SGNH/GDSL hydrolase family protein [Actinomycetota bacterium]MCB9413787.1 SGNH/GDSL hydrolase family protein [Actinomycetota bacterium]HPJ20176.1 SGNH/GDSL hydrolase family protein [Actinomycetota bacterium]